MLLNRKSRRDRADLRANANFYRISVSLILRTVIPALEKVNEWRIRRSTPLWRMVSRMKEDVNGVFVACLGLCSCRRTGELSL